MFKCFRCADFQVPEMFRVRTDTGKRRRVCKACENAENLARSKALKGTPKKQESSRRYSLKQYGLTPEIYDAMLTAQSGTCAICPKPIHESRGGRLCVDHDHDTGAVRGLLCSACNTAIGLLREDPQVLTSAIAYLKNGGHDARSLCM